MTAAARTPLVASENPLRKQTLLGIAPSAAAAAAPGAGPLTTAEPVPASAVETPLVRADNPLRKQTLLGVAPPPGAAAPEPTTGEAALDSAALTSPNDSLPLPVASDAPTTLDLGKNGPALGAAAAGAEPAASEPSAHAPAVISPDDDDHDDTELKPRGSRGLWLAGAAVLAAAAAVALVALPRLEQTQPAEPARKAAADPKPVEPPAALAPAPEVKPKADEGAQPTTPDPLPSEPDASKAKLDDPAASPSASASAAPPSGEVIRIEVKSDPPGARLFWKGKPVGTTPFTLEYQPGEKHAYEMGLPGFLTRKVVIDGSKPEVSIGLKPDPAAPTGAKRRK